MRLAIGRCTPCSIMWRGHRERLGCPETADEKRPLANTEINAVTGVARQLYVSSTSASESPPTTTYGWDRVGWISILWRGKVQNQRGPRRKAHTVGQRAGKTANHRIFLKENYGFIIGLL
jgi:hypothetical protein